MKLVVHLQSNCKFKYALWLLRRISRAMTCNRIAWRLANIFPLLADSIIIPGRYSPHLYQSHNISKQKSYATTSLCLTLAALWPLLPSVLSRQPYVGEYNDRNSTADRKYNSTNPDNVLQGAAVFLAVTYAVEQSKLDTVLIKVF